MYLGDMTLIGTQVSMFSRKLEAQLLYQNIPFSWQFKTLEATKGIEQRAGTHFIPLLKTPEGWLVNDTIAIGPMLNDRFYQCPVIPSQSLARSLCFILEDYFNHWLPRHALHSRWCYEENSEHISESFGANLILDKTLQAPLSDLGKQQVAGMSTMAKDAFGLKACLTQGAGPDQIEAMQTDFHRMKDLLVAHLSEFDFLLGARACLADFALAGALSGHFLIDPAPSSWLGAHKDLFDDYVARLAQGAHDSQKYSDWESPPETLLNILNHAQTKYHAFATASLEAAAQGKKEFTINLGDGDFTARSMKRLDKARLHVQNELNRSNAENTALKDNRVMDFYKRPAIIE